MDEDAKAKTAFNIYLGLYQFTKIPFGLRSAPATLQRLMACILTGLIGLICLVFLYDVIIYTKLDVFQHLYDILVVLWVIHNAGLKVKG